MSRILNVKFHEFNSNRNEQSKYENTNLNRAFIIIENQFFAALPVSRPRELRRRKETFDRILCKFQSVRRLFCLQIYLYPVTSSIFYSVYFFPFDTNSRIFLISLISSLSRFDSIERIFVLKRFFLLYKNILSLERVKVSRNFI